MNKRIKKFLSILLMVCMTIGMVPMTAQADDPPVTYTVTINGGTADKTVAAEGEVVTITADIPTGSTLHFWTNTISVEYTDNTSFSSPVAKFIMPNSEVTATAYFRRDITSSFTDVNFKNAIYSLISNISSPEPIYDYHVEPIRTLPLDSKGIESLAGIEHFKSLENLHCEGNNITELNLSGMKNLKYLHCNGNPLSVLNLSGDVVLKELYCQDNELTNLDISSNSLLTNLTCQNNKLRTLDVSNNLSLRQLDCSNNYMSSQSSIKGLNINITTNFTFDPQKTIYAESYPITVIGGTANPTTAQKDTSIQISYSEVSGKYFKEWKVTSGDAILYSPTSDETVFKMPENPVVITAISGDLGSILVSNDGNGTVSSNLLAAKPGEYILLEVSPNPGYQFKGWEILSQNLTLTIFDRTFFMPEGNVEIKATFEKKASEGPTGGGSSSGGNNKDDKNDKPSNPIETNPNTPTTTNNPTMASADIKADDNGSYNISDTAISDAIKNAQELAKKNGNLENGIAIELNIVGASNDSDINMGLSESVIDQLIESGAKTLLIKQNGMVLNLDLEVLKTIGGSKGDLNLNVSKMDPTKLSSEAQTAIGNRPVYEINLMTAGGDAITDLGGGKFTMDIPYILGGNENPENLYGIYVNKNGMVEWLNDSNYDAKKQTLRFTTNHLSTYAIGYKENTALPSFSDIANHWAKDDIEFVVNKGLFNGVGKGKFAPNMSMTRGMFVTVLGKLAKADISNYVTSTFTDVKTDAYYMGYVQWAVENNIVSGVGNGRFSPNQSMTREQMATIMVNYAKTMNLDIKTINQENAFVDNANISGYAKDAVRLMQMAGIISGKIGNKFDPQGTATRAEVSALLRRFIEGIE